MPADPTLPEPRPDDEGREAELPAHVTPALRSRFRRWANRLRGRYGVPIYLCGSALREDNPDPRDWDIRLMLPDEDFDIRFGPVSEWIEEGRTGNWTRTRFRWSDQCVKDTKDFAAWCLLNGDVQIYPESHATALYGREPRVRIDSFPDDEAALTPHLASLGATDTGRYVPGKWVCPTCGFVQAMLTINAHSGAVSASAERALPCPNDGQYMERQTWEAHARDLEAMLVAALDRERSAPLGATAQSEPRWPDMNGPCPHGHCEWDLGSHVATPRDGLRCPGWQDGRVPYRAKTIEWSRLHDSDENAGFHKVCAPLGATDEGLREAVERYLAALDAYEGAWSEPECIADVFLALAALRAALQAGG